MSCLVLCPLPVQARREPPLDFVHSCGVGAQGGVRIPLLGKQLGSEHPQLVVWVVVWEDKQCVLTHMLGSLLRLGTFDPQRCSPNTPVDRHLQRFWVQGLSRGPILWLWLLREPWAHVPGCGCGCDCRLGASQAPAATITRIGTKHCATCASLRNAPCGTRHLVPAGSYS